MCHMWMVCRKSVGAHKMLVLCMVGEEGTVWEYKHCSTHKVWREENTVEGDHNSGVVHTTMVHSHKEKVNTPEVLPHKVEGHMHYSHMGLGHKNFLFGAGIG